MRVIVLCLLGKIPVDIMSVPSVIRLDLGYSKPDYRRDTAVVREMRM
jgi:hypothetical protein